MSTRADRSGVFDHGKRRRMVTYAVLGLILLGLLVWGLIVYDRARDTQEAQEKAQQLIDKFVATGLPTGGRTAEEVARVFGDDGGAVCASPTSDLTIGALRAHMSNGAGGPGQRPVTVDEQVVLGERLIIETYCPEKLAAFDRFVQDTDFANVAG
jgi:hypothetical protein